MKNSRWRVLSLFLAVLLVLPFFGPVASAKTEVTRLAGPNRYETAIQLSKKYDASKSVVIASGENFPDALAGSGLASSLKAPLLLSSKSQLSKAALNEIGRLGAEKAYVLGGLSTITDEALADLNIQKVRISGKNRYETSFAIAEAMEEVTSLIVVNGTSFPDALSAGGLVDGKTAVILTDGSNLVLPSSLQGLPVTILGGEASVAKNIEEQYQGKRIAGRNRYETSLLVAKASGRENVLLADGTNYPDALSAVSLASKMPASILLTAPGGMGQAATTYAKSLNEIVIVGGKNSVSEAVEKQLKDVEPQPTEPSHGRYKVVRVVDGDTIIVNYNGKDERVRLIGVDTPESVHPDQSKNTECGIIASNFTKEKLENREVGLEFDVQERDRYGRLLAYVWLGETMFNELLLTKGMAQVATFPPNVRYVEKFQALEKIAREHKVGLWGRQCDSPQDEPKPTPPSDNGGYDPNNPKDGLLESPYPGRLIKGNISASGEKIYHMPGQRDYNKTVIDESKGERWFATEQEAVQAGWRKAKR